jgi:tRNA-binding protein
MSTELKPVVAMSESLELLDIRVGRVLAVETASKAKKPSYKLTADFGRFGVRISVARLTSHPADELLGKLILGVLNFEAREVGGIMSEFLCLGVQLPKAESGEATIVAPLMEVKLGSKLF